MQLQAFRLGTLDVRQSPESHFTYLAFFRKSLRYELRKFKMFAEQLLTCYLTEAVDTAPKTLFLLAF